MKFIFYLFLLFCLFSSCEKRHDLKLTIKVLYNSGQGVNNKRIHLEKGKWRALAFEFKWIVIDSYDSKTDAEGKCEIIIEDFQDYEPYDYLIYVGDVSPNGEYYSLQMPDIRERNANNEIVVNYGIAPTPR